MEEAEVLCDRLGIFVDGGFQCIGNPKEVNYLFTCMAHISTFFVQSYLIEHLPIFSLQSSHLKARYGGTYVLTVTTSPEHEQEVEQLVHRLSPNANRIYHISGTQKFELPKQEVKIADVFNEVESAKSRFSIHAWGLAATTLEDVFIKVAKGSPVFNDVA